MQRLEVSGAVRPLYGTISVKGLIHSNYATTVHFQMLFSFLFTDQPATRCTHSIVK